jgi:hypothetical protein
MRAIGIDVHHDLCEVAISEGGRLRSVGAVADARATTDRLDAASWPGCLGPT